MGEALFVCGQMLLCQLTFAYVLSLLKEENEDVGIEKGWKKRFDKLIVLIFYCCCKKNYQNLCGLQPHPFIISISMTHLGSDIKVILELHSFLDSLKKNPHQPHSDIRPTLVLCGCGTEAFCGCSCSLTHDPLSSNHQWTSDFGFLISLSSPVKGSCD